MFEALGTQGSVIALAIVMTTFVLALIGATVSRFYRRCGADEALVRTGHGGNRVVLGGGVMVYPILHQLMRVSLRSVKLSVERSAKNALVTKDKIKANVTTELYVKVGALVKEDVLAAARIVR
jgi:flotillin